MTTTNTNEVTPADAGLEYADYCDCENPIETITPPAVCLVCNRYIDPKKLTTVPADE